MVKPRFSVIIPTLNEEKFVGKLLTSLALQTIKNFEVIVVDGKSNDRTVSVVKKFVRVLPLRLIISDRRGVSRQRNIGAQAATSQWLVFVDADSILLPNFFERVGKYIDRKHSKFFTAWLKADRDNAGNAIAAFLLNMTIEGGVLIDKPWSPGPLTIVRKDVYTLAGGYDENATYGEDHDFSLVLLDRGIRFKILREILYIYSFRRFRKEGTLKVLERNLRSELNVLATGRGPKHISGFIGGGSIYQEEKPKKKKKNRKIFKKLEQSISKFIQEIIEQ